MGLESGNYISDLRKDWPLSEDYRREGDDHLRLIKKVLVQTFPNLDGPVTLTPAQVNDLADYIQQVETELYKHVVPIGTIQMWSTATAPTGWLLCNGASFNAVTYPTLAAVLGGSNTPDLRNRFIVGAGQNYAAKATGGSDTATSSAAGAHDHGGTTGSHALTMQELPDLSAGLTIEIESDWTANSQSDSHNVESWLAGGRNVSHSSTELPVTISQPGGGGSGHTHTLPNSVTHQHTVDTRSQYYALTYIIKALEPTEISPP